MRKHKSKRHEDKQTAEEKEASIAVDDAEDDFGFEAESKKKDYI